MGEKYGVTDNGFVLKRLDTIMEDVHAKLTDGWGFDTRVSGGKALDVLITTFCGQVAEVWEAAQDSYYAKYPSTAEGLNLDNSVQFGGVRRAPARQTIYPLHCTGLDGTVVPAGSTVETDSNPAVRLNAVNQFIIARDHFNSVEVRVAVLQERGEYSVTINNREYVYSNNGGDAAAVLTGLKNAITAEGFTVSVSGDTLSIACDTLTADNVLALSSNLTTKTVTVIAEFATEDYGSISIPDTLISVIVSSVTGLRSVINLISPTLGADKETDVELRQAYLKRSAIRSSSSVDGIIAEILEGVAGIETATGGENTEDETDPTTGLPPHSIEIIADGGADEDIAAAILRKKPAGIQTYGNTSVGVPTSSGDTVRINFSRPTPVYVWLKIVLYGDRSRMMSNFATVTQDAVMECCGSMTAGESLRIQTVYDDIYGANSGLSYISCVAAVSADAASEPATGEYSASNIAATPRERLLFSVDRIEVTYGGNNP